MNQKSFASIVLVIVIVVIIGIVGYFTFVKKSTPIDQQPKPTITQNSQTNLKTYKNDEYGFEFKYPNNFFIKDNSRGERGLIVLSNDNKFEDKETALIISLNIVKISGGEDGTLPKEGTYLRIEQFEKRMQAKIVTRFAGDPPWGYYNVAIPLPNSQGDFVNFNTRIHQKDDPAYGGQYTDLKTFSQILSTFVFTE